mgnify:CR=1 FL=1
MDSVIKRTWSSLALPLLMLAAGIVAARRVQVPDAWQAWVTVLPGLVMLVGALLGIRFRRHAVAIAMGTLGALWTLLAHPDVWPSRLDGQTLLDGMMVLVPVSLGLLAWTGERGWRTVQGMGRNVALVGMVAGLWWMAKHPDAQQAQWLTRDFGPTRLFDAAGLTSMGAAAFGVSALAVLGALWRQPRVLLGGYLATLVASALAFGADPSRTAFYVTAAALILTVAVMQESYSMAYLDELTRLPGRRALNEELLKLGRRYTIAMLDVDHFKQFNDRYGHDVGDDVLRMVAAQMRKVRGGGRPFRYGGEEFSIVFAGKSVDHAEEHLEAVRVLIEEASLTIAPKRRSKAPKWKFWERKPAGRGKKVSVTISIGAAQRAQKHRSPEEVIKAADKALYKAKKKGRNQVQCDRSK